MSSNKYTVITGASSGIGRAAACAFAGRGCNLVLTARRADRLEELQQTLRAQHPDQEILVFPADLAQPGGAHRLYEAVRGLEVDTWVNNAGFGSYAGVGAQDLQKAVDLLRVDVEALMVLSSLYVHDYQDVSGTQLINVSSCGGYMLVPNAVTYCAAKFFVSAFTEGLAWELRQADAKLQAKVLAPAATKTEFGRVANDTSSYDYDQAFGTYHSSEQMAQFLLALHDSTKSVGLVDRKTFAFRLLDPQFPHAGNSVHNQNMDAVSAGAT